MSTDNHNHDDEIDVDVDDDEVEFEVNIDPREDQLEKLGIDGNDFEEALYAALDARGDELEASESDHVASTLEDMSITVGGKTYRLGDLASVSIEEFDEDDEDPE